MPDPMTLLKRDHRDVEAMLVELAGTKTGKHRVELLGQVQQALTAHMEAEEQALYPVVQEQQGDKPALEANIEHDLVRDALDKANELLKAPGFGAVIEMLIGGITHHIEEEEEEILPALKKSLSEEEWEALGEQLAAAKGADVSS